MSDDLLHGGAVDAMRRRFPDAPTPWIDLSTGVNPFAYPHRAVGDAALRPLPTHAATIACRRAMAAAFGAPEDSLLLAPGSELLIRLLPTVIAPQSVAVLQPTYGDHVDVWRAHGADVMERAGVLDCADGADAVVVCNPNNPDGRIFAVEEIERARARLAARGGWLIVDEAYADLRPEHSIARRGGADGLITLRSFGKFYGLAGVRLGALLAPAPIRTRMAERLGVWAASGPALEIGARAYADNDWRARMRRRLAAERARRDETLARAGAPAIGGTDLFRFVEVDDAYAVWETLARRGVYTRRFAWTRRHLRVGLPPDEEAYARFAAALTL
ncbi:MAG: threonine-phosphate decarboxylase CobD [Pseudomonadota bacterium]